RVPAGRWCDMRATTVAASLALLLAGADGTLSAENDQPKPPLFVADRTALPVAPTTGSETGSSKLTALSDAELAVRLATLQAELIRRQKLRTAKIAEASAGSPAAPPKSAVSAAVPPKKGTAPTPQTNPAAYYQQQFLRENPGLYVNETPV